MDLDKTLKAITSVLRKNKKKVHTQPELSKEELEFQMEIEETYNDYIETKRTPFLKSYLQLIMSSSNVPESKRKEYFLRKISDDKTVLDYIVEEKIFVGQELSFFFASDFDLLKVFLDHKNSEILVYTNESILMKNYKGTTVLEYLIANDIIDNYWIKYVKSKTIIDLLVKYNKKELLKHACEEVLLMNIEPGKTVLEYLIENNYAIKDTIEKVKKPIVFDLLKKYNNTELMQYLNETVLETVRKGKTILDEILDLGVKPKLEHIYGEKVVKVLARRHEFELMKNASTYTIRKKIPGTKTTIFEYLLLKGIICTEAMDSLKYEFSSANEFLTMIKKHNKLDILSTLTEDELLKKPDGKTTLLETLLDANIKPSKVREYTKKESIEILLERELYDILQYCSEVQLNKQTKSGKPLYQELIDRGLRLNTSYVEAEEVARYIFDKKRVDLYPKILSSTLLRIYKDNKTYLDFILEESKTNPQIDLSDLLVISLDIYEAAKLYINFAKHDMQMYLAKLTKEKLLKEKKGKKFIQVLLDMDADLTINKILDPDIKQDIEIAMILKLRGFEQKDVKFESVTTKLEREYLTNLRFEYEALKLDEESEELLSELNDVMDDKKSDPYLIYALLATYRNLIYTNSKYAGEIQQLIEIKKDNPNFVYKYVQEGAHFSPISCHIGMEDANIDTLNHETGHALFSLLTNQKVPNGFEEIIMKLRNDNSFLQRTAEYSKRFHTLKKAVQDEVELRYMPKYDESITEEKKQEIQCFLDDEITINKRKYLKLGYSEEILDIIFSKTYTLEEYLEQDRRVKKENMVDLILRTRYGAFLSTGDYIDAIHKGKFKGGVLKDNNGEEIKPAYGHGIEYYSRGLDWIFNEMIANYSEIVKSRDPNGLKELREYVGDELVDFIIDYYDENILYSNKYSYSPTLTR